MRKWMGTLGGCLLVAMTIVCPGRAGAADPSHGEGETTRTLDPAGSAKGEEPSVPAVTLALLDVHVPSTRVSASRIHRMTRTMEAVARRAVDSSSCRVIPVAEVRGSVGPGGTRSCLTPHCIAAIGQRLGATYLVKPVVASVSGGLMVRLDVRDGKTGAVMASKSLVAARKRDLEPVTEWLLLTVLERVPGTGIDAASVPAPPRHVEAFASLKQLRRVQYVPPRYPRRARRKHVEGVVMVEVLCRADGKVKRVRWLSGDRVFRRSVRKAVREWGFAPQPVDFRFRQPVWFRLETLAEESVTQSGPVHPGVSRDTSQDVTAGAFSSASRR